MREEEVRRIAEQFVKDKSLEKCSIESIRRFQTRDDDASKMRDEWTVLFRFDCNDDEGIIANRAIVIVDDATGEPQFLESL